MFIISNISYLVISCVCESFIRINYSVLKTAKAAQSCWAAPARCGRSGHVEALYDGCISVLTVVLRTTWPSCVRRQHLRSASRRLLVVQRIKLDFAVVGPTVWNALSNDLRYPELSIASFGRLLRTHYNLVSAVFSAFSASEAPCDNALYNWYWYWHLLGSPSHARFWFFWNLIP